MDLGHMTRRLGAVLGLCAFLGACSADGGPASAPGGVAGVSGLVGTNPTGASGAAGRTGASTAANSGSGSGPLDAANACGIGTVSAKLAPVNMFVMFDRSGSMEDEDKWTNATAALAAFFGNPGTAGLRVALRFFPHDQPASGCNEDECSVDACSQPLVDIAALTAEPAPTDAHEGRLLAAIRSSAPGNGGGGGRNNGGGGGGGTPIYAALEGSLAWAMGYKASHPNENTVVVFLTDGEPNGCEENFGAISALAADALARTGVTTYAIGLQGSREDQMDQLAAAGGTKQGIFINNSANAQQELLTALDAIRGMALTCDFPLPASTRAGEMIDPTKINVTFTSGASAARTFGQVPNQAGCSTTDAWYYDRPAAPTGIFLCPSTCEKVRQDDSAQLRVLLGCTTQLLAPD
jgi:hypothetical protein